MHKLFSRERLRKLRFVRDTIVLLIGAFLVQSFAYSIPWGIIFVIVVPAFTILAIVLRRYKKKQFDAFEKFMFKSFAWSIDQVAQLFLATGITILVLTQLSSAGFILFGTLLFIGLTMEFSASPIKYFGSEDAKPEPGNKTDGQRWKKLRDALSSIIPTHLRPQLAFYSGLILGGTVSLILYILVFAAFLSGVLQALVAGGTLALAGVTSYVTIRDRREALARELADRVYVPMRKDSEAWQDPEPMFSSSTWTSLKKDAPYLTIRVPSELQKQFDRAERLIQEMALLSTPMKEVLQKPTANDSGRIRIWKGTTNYFDFNMLFLLIQLLKSKQSLREFAEEHMAKNRPTVTEWELGWYLSGGAGVTDTKATEDHIATTLRQLESMPEAILYRKLYNELADIGRKAHERIEKELRKPLAPKN